jgi:2-polyprenyl-3-methyl-5-hydroxy-6-metoxy-1,4-benzoquinol methylase
MIISKADWQSAQSYERDFWASQVPKGNSEQAHRNMHYYRTLFWDYFSQRDFTGLVLADVGSGPGGILHLRKPSGGRPFSWAAERICVDPLMPVYLQQGYDITADDVRIASVAAEDWTQEAGRVDVAFCLNALDHMRDPALALRRIATALVSRGELVLCCDLRPVDRLDDGHRLAISEAWLTEQLTANGLTGRRWLVPHQGEDPVMQFCGVYRKEAV